MSENQNAVAKYAFISIGVIWGCAAVTKLYYTHKASSLIEKHGWQPATPGVTHNTLQASWSYNAAVHGTWLAILGAWLLKKD